MTEQDWFQELQTTGLTHEGARLALPLIDVFQPVVDRLVAAHADPRRAPWEVADFLQRVIRAVALRAEHTASANAVSTRGHLGSTSLMGDAVSAGLKSRMGAGG